MNKKIIYGGLIGGIFAFFFGWLLFGILLMEPMLNLSTESMKNAMLPEDQMNIVLMLLSNLIWGFFTAYVLVSLAKVEGWMAGAKISATLAFMIVLAYDLSFHSMTSLFTMNGILLDVVSNVIMGGTVGAVVGLVISKVKD